MFQLCFCCYAHTPLQVQSSVHGKSSFLHKHLFLHPFLHPQCFKADNVFDASSFVIHVGKYLPSLFVHPQDVAFGSDCIGLSDCAQTKLKKENLLVQVKCCCFYEYAKTYTTAFLRNIVHI